MIPQMLGRLARAIVRRYPAAWRDRYEAEILTLLDDAPPRWRDVVDLARGGVVERARALVEPAAHPFLVLGARYVLLPAMLFGTALAVGTALRWRFGPLSEAGADSILMGVLMIMAALAAAWLVRAVWTFRRRTPRWSIGLPGLLAWMAIVVSFPTVMAWRNAFDGLGLTIWLYHAVVTTAFVLSRSPVRPGQPLLDAVNQLLVAREQLGWARLELTRCETLAAQGAAVAAELTHARAETARWEAQQDEALQTLTAMGYRARFDQPR